MRAKKREDVLQQFELHEYISGFKSSSDRALYVVFINTVVSLLVLVALWNTQAWSWSWQGLKKAEGRLIERREAEPKVEPALAIRAENSDEIRKLALRNMIFVPVPGLGVQVHHNDIGIVGGVSLAFLSLLLCFVMVRQHENLYLALFKVGRLAEQERITRDDGDSQANFLYHALAMGQVLNYPPTLARWAYGWRNYAAATARWFVLLLPAIVHFLVVLVNVLTIDIAINIWDQKVWFRMGLQFLLLGAITFFCALAAVYLRASNKRWRATFDAVNPGLQYVRQRKWRHWMRIVRAPKEQLPATLRELTFTFRPEDESEIAECVGKGELPMSEDPPLLDQNRIRTMAEIVYADAQKKAGVSLDGKVVSCETIENVRREKTWFVEMLYRYRVAKQPEVVKAPEVPVDIAPPQTISTEPVSAA